MHDYQLDSGDTAQVLPSCTKLFLDATSLGGVESLMEWRYKHDPTVGVGLLRVSVGLEAPRDLINDIRQAVDAARTQLGQPTSSPRGHALLAHPSNTTGV
jgi:cystathionine beta-lyase/cystathionine gamma-synthase